MQRLLKLTIILTFFSSFIIANSVVSRKAEGLFGLGDIVLDPSNLAQNTLQARTILRELAQGAQLLQTAMNFQGDMNGLLGLTDRTSRFFGLDLGVGEIRRMARVYNDIEYGLNSFDRMISRGDYEGALDETYWLTRDFNSFAGASDRFSQKIATSANTYGNFTFFSPGQNSEFIYKRARGYENTAHIGRATALQAMEYNKDNSQTIETLRQEAANALEAANGNTAGGTGSVRHQLHAINTTLLAIWEKTTQIYDVNSRLLLVESTEATADSARFMRDMELTSDKARLYESVLRPEIPPSQ